ncbi:MAG: NADH-quinone oxidoreductase subunit J [Alphaproteobacteria bacterium]|nr:NADH-quinone oxidoreductase subunit J [Alphaproteobacteria bacterium]
MIQSAFFYLFSGTLVGSAFMVIAARNPVHSVLFLILAFLNASGLFLMAGAELLAMIMVIVYVGAVAVLFLFVVMMLDINFRELSQGIAKYGLVASLVGLIFAGELITAGIVWASHPKAQQSISLPIPTSTTNAHAIGEILYTDYFYPFQLAGVILLVAMIGAIVLTLRKRSSARYQFKKEQLNRSPANSLKMVKVGLREGVSYENISYNEK